MPALTGSLQHLNGSPFFAHQKKRIFLFFLWGDAVRNRPQNPAPGGCLFSTRKSRSEVSGRQEFGEENCLGKERVGWTGQKKEKRMRKKKVGWRAHAHPIARQCLRGFDISFWAAANGGLSGVCHCLAALPRNRPNSAFIAFFLPFSAFFSLFQWARGSPDKTRKRRKKAFFLGFS